MNKSAKIILFIAGAFFILFLIQVLAQTGLSWGIDFKIASNWATTLSGLLSFFSFVLIYFSLQQQQNSFNRNQIDTSFFEKLKIHRENVLNMEHEDPESTEKENIQTRKGVRVFMTILNEFNKAFFYIDSRLGPWETEKIYKNESELTKDKQLLSSNNLKIDLRLLNKINISYLIVYYGATIQGKKILSNFLKKKYNSDFVDSIVDYYEKMPVCYSKYRREFDLNNYVTTGGNFNKYFSGHQNRLGHYFRHMFQTVNFIDSIEELSYKEKYGYIKTYRAQFSTYEQGIIFLNSLSQLGIAWEYNQNDNNKKLITKYNLIKNLSNEFIRQINICDFYPNIAYEVESFDKEKRKELENEYK